MDWDEYRQDMKDIARAQKGEAWERNMVILEATGLSFTVKEQSRTVLFRGNSRPPIDFYPSTDRWVYRNRTHSGDATAFLAFYNELPEAGALKSCGTCAYEKKDPRTWAQCRKCQRDETLHNPKPFHHPKGTPERGPRDGKGQDF